jgi:hypothetical protein
MTADSSPKRSSADEVAPPPQPLADGMLRAAIAWPFPRLGRVMQCLRSPDDYDETDGFSYLPDSGF